MHRDIADAPPPPDDISLAHVLSFLREDARPVTVLVAVATAAAIAYAFLAPAYYTSNMALYPVGSDYDDSFGPLWSLATDLGFFSGGPQRDIRITDILSSRRLRTMVLEEPWSSQRHEEKVDLITLWGWDDLDRPEAMEKALRRLERLVHVSESTSGLIEVRVDMPEPVLSRDVASFLFAATRDYIQDEYHSNASLNLEFVQNRLEEAHTELRHAEDTLENFLVANRRLVDSPTLQLQYERLVREVEVSQEVFITLRQQSEIAKIAEAREALAVNLLDPPEVPASRSRPKRLLVITLTFFGSILLGCGISVARHRASHEDLALPH